MQFFDPHDIDFCVCYCQPTLYVHTYEWDAWPLTDWQDFFGRIKSWSSLKKLFGNSESKSESEISCMNIDAFFGDKVKCLGGVCSWVLQVLEVIAININPEWDEETHEVEDY